MSNVKISGLTSAGALTGTEAVPIVQSGVTVQSTTQNISNLALPSQSGQNGKYLKTDGSTASWGTISPGAYISCFNMEIGSGSIFALPNYDNTGNTYTFVLGAGNNLEIQITSYGGNKLFSFPYDTIVGSPIFTGGNFYYPYDTGGGGSFNLLLSYVNQNGVSFDFSSGTFTNFKLFIQIIFNPF